MLTAVAPHKSRLYGELSVLFGVEIDSRVIVAKVSTVKIKGE